MPDTVEGLCPDDDLAVVVDVLTKDDLSGLVRLDGLIRDFPADPRLHFLKGSVLAGLQRYEEGYAAMRQAVDIAPDFGLARFQLGFLEFTSGRPAEAAQTWLPFDALPDDEPFKLFATGLCHLARDEFAETISFLQRGMALNTENPLINGDMQLIIDEIGTLAASPQAGGTVTGDHSSATQILLQQDHLRDSVKATKH